MAVRSETGEAHDAEPAPAHVLTLELNDGDMVRPLAAFMERVRIVAGGGHSFEIMADEDEPFRVGIDGDGADRILRVLLDGKPVKIDAAGNLANDGDHETDAYGRVHLERVPITKAAINEYKGSEIPGYQAIGLDPSRLYKLLRDPEELKRAASTFNGIQLLIKHTPVSAEDHKPYDIAGTVGTRAEFEHPYLYNDLSLWARPAIDGVEDESRRELSSSYGYDPDMTPGQFEGQPYDGVMRNVRGNHVALVIKGRAGPDVAIDEHLVQPPVKTEIPMTKKTAVPSRTAIRLQAALSALAMDSKPDLSAALNGVRAKTISAQKSVIAKAIRVAFDAEGGAVGATPDDVIMKVLDMVEGQAKAEPAEMDEAPVAATEPTAAPGAGGKMDKAKLMEWLKAKGLGEDDMSELDGMYGDPTEDEDETPEEKAERMRKEQAADKAAKDNMVSREAMDQAIATTAETVTAQVLRTAREIASAFAYVRPWVGELANDAAITSPESVYRKALGTLGVSGADKLHADALRPILDAQPKPGVRRDPTVAMDAASIEDFDKRFPHLTHIRGAA